MHTHPRAPIPCAHIYLLLLVTNFDYGKTAKNNIFVCRELLAFISGFVDSLYNAVDYDYDACPYGGHVMYIVRDEDVTYLCDRCRKRYLPVWV